MPKADIGFNFGAQTAGFEKGMSRMTKSALKAAALIGGAFIGIRLFKGMVDVGTTFEDRMTRIKSIVKSDAESVGKDLDKLIAGYRKTSMAAAEAVGMPAVEAAKAIEELVKVGLTAADDLDALSIRFIKFAEVSESNMADSMETSYSLMRALGMEAADLPAILDKITAAVNASAFNFEGFIQAIRYATSAGAAFKEPIDELFALMVMFREEGGLVNTTVGRNLRSAFLQASRGAGSLLRAMEKLDLSFQDINLEHMTLRDLMIDLSKRGADVGDAVDIFGGRAGTIMAKLIMQTSEGGTRFEDLKNKIADSNGLLDSMAETILNESPLSRIKQMKESFKNLGVAIFNTFIANRLISFVNGLKIGAQWIRRCAEEMSVFRAQMDGERMEEFANKVAKFTATLASWAAGFLTALVDAWTLLEALVKNVGVAGEIVIKKLQLGFKKFKNLMLDMFSLKIAQNWVADWGLAFAQLKNKFKKVFNWIKVTIKKRLRWNTLVDKKAELAAMNAPLDAALKEEQKRYSARRKLLMDETRVSEKFRKERALEAKALADEIEYLMASSSNFALSDWWEKAKERGMKKHLFQGFLSDFKSGVREIEELPHLASRPWLQDPKTPLPKEEELKESLFKVGEFGADLGEIMASAWDKSIDGMIDKTHTLEDTVRGMGRSILKMFTDIIAKMAIANLFAKGNIEATGLTSRGQALPAFTSKSSISGGSGPFGFLKSILGAMGQGFFGAGGGDSSVGGGASNIMSTFGQGVGSSSKMASAGGNQTIIIQAVDTQSFAEALNRNRATVNTIVGKESRKRGGLR